MYTHSFNRISKHPSRADVSAMGAIKAFNKINRISVGADVSAFRGFHDILPILLISIIGL
jgi:hypothetical protein